jgi:hypothetical protein
MDEETTLYSAIAALFLGAVAWLGRFFVGRTVERIDRVEEQVQHVRQHCIKIEALAETEARLLTSIHDNSKVIRGQIDILNSRIERSNERIDNFYDKKL